MQADLEGADEAAVQAGEKLIDDLQSLQGEIAERADAAAETTSANWNAFTDSLGDFYSDFKRDWSNLWE